jgi:hypothetical protein
MKDFFNGQDSNLVDGYQISGEPWIRPLRDGFNNFTAALNGGQGKGATFIAMCSTAFMITDYNLANKWAKRVKDTTDDSNPKFHYFGNTMRLLSLLYMSGRFTNVTTKVGMIAFVNNKFVCADQNYGANYPLYANRTERGL